MNKKDSKKRLINFNLIIFVLSTVSLQSYAGPSNAPAEGPVWVYLNSSLKACDDAESNRQDIDEARNLLEAQGIRILSSERNISSENTGHKECGTIGNYVSCFLIFPKEREKAMSAGFKTDGNCGKPYKKRVH